jgi:hypothetical protein
MSKPKAKPKNQPALARPHRRTEIARDLLVIIGVSLLVRAAFMWFFGRNVVSGDLHAFLKVLVVLARGGNPYKELDTLNYWPPFWMLILFFLLKLGLLLGNFGPVLTKLGITGISYVRLIQGFLMLAEAVLMAILYLLLRGFFPTVNARRFVLYGISLNPVTVLMVCQHCNFDVLIGIWVLLFVFTLLRFIATANPVYWLLASLFLGLGILTKTVPIMLTPLLLAHCRRLNTSTRFLGVLLLLGPVTLGLGIVAALGPPNLISKMLNYRSSPGFFGVTGLAELVGATPAFGFWYSKLFIYCYLAIVACISVAVWWGQPSSRSTVLLATVILLVVPTFGPGYAPQYTYWYLPLLLVCYAFSPTATKRVLLAFFIVAASTYLVEYSMMPSLGAFLPNALKNDRLYRLGDTLNSHKNCTLIRLPLFLTYLVLGFTLWRDASSEFDASSQTREQL